VLDVRAGDSSVDSGVSGGASITYAAGRSWTRIDSTTSESAVSNDPIRSAIVSPSAHVEDDRDVAERRLPSTRTTGLPVS